MTPLAREFDACGECRLEIGGPRRYRTLSEDEIRIVSMALERYEQDMRSDRQNQPEGSYPEWRGRDGL